MTENKILQNAVLELNKTQGEGTVFIVNDNNSIDIERTSCGSLTIDIATGGGFPNGRIIEIYGAESSGKTTLALHAIAENQKLGRYCAMVDYEHAYDKKYAAKLGVNNDELLVSQPENAENGLDVVDVLLSTGELSLIVVDSVAAMLPKSELEGEMGKSSIGVHARLMSQAMRKLTAKASKHNCTIIFINQLREKIGVMFGDPRVTTGGNALKFYSTMRIETVKGTKGTTKDEQGNFTFNRGKFKVQKNKTFPPFRDGEYDLEFGLGISKLGEILDIGTDMGIVLRKGAWFYYNDTKLGQGKAAAKLLLKDNEELALEIETKIREEIQKQQDAV